MLQPHFRNILSRTRSLINETRGIPRRDEQKMATTSLPEPLGKSEHSFPDNSHLNDARNADVDFDTFLANCTPEIPSLEPFHLAYFLVGGTKSQLSSNTTFVQY
jgi:hypothetical protein